MKDILDVFEKLTDVGLNITKLQMAKESQQDAMEAAAALEERKIRASQLQEDYRMAKQVAGDIHKQNESEINKSIDELNKWNVNALDLNKVSKESQTPGAKKIWDERGIEISEGLDDRFGIANTAQEIVDNMTFANQVQGDIIDDLKDKERKILDLIPLIDKVGYDAGIKGVKDIKDFQSFVNKVKSEDVIDEVFFQDEEVSDFREELKGNPWLEQAFTSLEMLKLAEPGEKEAAALYKAKYGASPFKSVKTDDPMAPVNETFSNLARTKFDEIGVLESRIRAKGDSVLKELPLGISAIKGDMDIYTDYETAKNRLPMIENEILNVISKGDDRDLIGSTDPMITTILENSRQGTPASKKRAVYQLHQLLIPQANRVSDISSSPKPDRTTVANFRQDAARVNIGSPTNPKYVDAPGWEGLGIDLGGWREGEDADKPLLEDKYLNALLSQWGLFQQRYGAEYLNDAFKELDMSKNQTDYKKDSGNTSVYPFY